jgi:hypothetical protein
MLNGVEVLLDGNFEFANFSKLYNIKIVAFETSDVSIFGTITVCIPVVLLSWVFDVLDLVTVGVNVLTDRRHDIALKQNAFL